jgi:hypothetical protein
MYNAAEFCNILIDRDKKIILSLAKHINAMHENKKKLLQNNNPDSTFTMMVGINSAIPIIENKIGNLCNEIIKNIFLTLIQYFKGNFDKIENINENIRFLNELSTNIQNE